jgi:hypothetical protein
MKTTRYQFETAVQSATDTHKEWLKEQYRAILESDKDYTRKCDYIGFSLLSIDQRVQSIDEEIKELQALKKVLKEAKEISLQTGAEIFREYGIERLDGAGISSITYTQGTTHDTTKIIIKDPTPLIEAGFYKKIIDEEKVMQYYHSDKYANLIQTHCTLEVQSIPKPARLKINKRKSSNNSTFTQSSTITAEEVA